MKRRSFLAVSGLGAAALAAPAVAEGLPSVRWRMSAGWPKNLDTIYGSAERLAARVKELTQGKFEIRVFPGGELVPYEQNMDAVSNGTVECNHVLSTAFIGKNSAVAFDTGLAFGLNARQHNAWLQFGGGMDLLREMYAQYNIRNFVAGNVNVQMGGWFRKEIKDVADLDGLKLRIGGIGGMVFSKLGAIPQQIPPSDIYSALERGTIDAAEWIGPYDDEKLGLYQVAPYYYSPGWFEGSASITCMVNEDAWNALPELYKQAFQVAANEETLLMSAQYDAYNPPALKELIAKGAKLKFFPREVMEAAYVASQEVWQELSDENPDFAKIFPEWQAFQKEQVSWFRVAEQPLDNFTFSQVSKS